MFPFVIIIAGGLFRLSAMHMIMIPIRIGA